MIKLVRFDDRRTGLVVQLPTGLHVIDVVASVSVLLPEDPISNGLLNGILKDGGSWAPLVEHWERVRIGLGRLSRLASIAPDHPRLVMRPFDRIHVASPTSNSKSIATLEIAEVNEIAFDPTGREAMARQFAEAPAAGRVTDEPVAEERILTLDDHRK
jgi:hypothetical protein